jgi:transketolase N-terminal domain/subunit
VNLLDWIYVQRKEGDPVILGNSHAALALYVVLERNGLCDAEEMIHKHGTHAGRDMEHGIWVSGGSLGQPETVAVGMAMADHNRTVWLVTSDGSCMEGATWEALRMGQYWDNLLVYIVFNGSGAYGKIRKPDLPEHATIEYVHPTRYPEWLRGLPGHYLKLSKEQYEELMK